MIISHSKKFIFIHNYKVAGTSIKYILSKYNNQSFKGSIHTDKLKLLIGVYPKIYSNQFSGHVSAIELKNRLPKQVFERYYKFGFVRNPWDWQVSLYTYMLKLETHEQHKLIKSMRNFDEYIDWRVNKDLHLQKEFFYDKDMCLVNFVGKMENLENDFNNVCKTIGIKQTLPHLNESRQNEDNFLKYYSQKSIDLLFEAFKEDVKLFNYRKPVL